MSARLIFTMFASVVLAGCGVAGTGAVAAVNGASAAEEAKAAARQLEKVQADVDAAQRKAAELREAADQ
jgi:hypothetical protein